MQNKDISAKIQPSSNLKLINYFFNLPYYMLLLSFHFQSPSLWLYHKHSTINNFFPMNNTSYFYNPPFKFQFLKSYHHRKSFLLFNLFKKKTNFRTLNFLVYHKQNFTIYFGYKNLLNHQNYPQKKKHYRNWS